MWGWFMWVLVGVGVGVEVGVEVGVGNDSVGVDVETLLSDHFIIPKVKQQYPYKEKNYTIGPFSNPKITGSLHGHLPHGRTGIIYWGDWLLLNSHTQQVIPRKSYTLHHIYCYQKNKYFKLFASGTSDERVTWGPHFPLNGNYLYISHSENEWIYSGVIQNLTNVSEVLLQYTIRYYEEKDFPPKYQQVIGMSFTSLPLHPLKDATQTFTPFTTREHISLLGPYHSTAEIVYVVGHLHVGGIGVNITNSRTGEEICYSVASHNPSVLCYLEVMLLFVCCLFVVCLLFVCCLFVVCLLFVCCLFVVCLLFVCCLFVVVCCCLLLFVVVCCVCCVCCVCYLLLFIVICYCFLLVFLLHFLKRKTFINIFFSLFFTVKLQITSPHIHSTVPYLMHTHRTPLRPRFPLNLHKPTPHNPHRRWRGDNIII
jgi:hypothetical protein